MGTACFVILHYNTIEDTRRCVESVKELDGQEDIRIVIVDNASPNRTGQLLSDSYTDDTDIAVILKGRKTGQKKNCRAWPPIRKTEHDR